MSKTIRISCDTKYSIDPANLKALQGDLKDLSKENYEKLKKEILTEGFDAPFFVWCSGSDGNYVLDGHQRLRVIMKMIDEGYDIDLLPYVPIQAKDMHEAKRKLLGYASQYGEVTSQGLYEFLEGSDIEFDEMDSRYRFPEINTEEFKNEFYRETKSSEGEDNIPEITESRVVYGDLFGLGSHRLLCGDATDRSMVERLMNGEKSEFCFTSPPYSNQRDYSGNLQLDPIHLAKFLSADCDLFAVNLGLQKKDHEIVPYWDDYIHIAKGFGLKLLSWNVWDKQQCGSVGQQTMMFPLEHEWIFIFGKEPREINKTEETKWRGTFKASNTSRNKDGTISKSDNYEINKYKPIGTVLRQFPEKARNHEFDHPAMFPVAFPEKYILACTQINDSVFEPFCGSGSTLIASEKTNRRCFGMEIDPHYCDIIIERWMKFSGKEVFRQESDGSLTPWNEILSKTQSIS